MRRSFATLHLGPRYYSQRDILECRFMMAAAGTAINHPFVECTKKHPIEAVLDVLAVSDVLLR